MACRRERPRSCSLATHSLAVIRRKQSSKQSRELPTKNLWPIPGIIANANRNPNQATSEPEPV